MATRFYLTNQDAPISAGFNSGWEQTAGAVSRALSFDRAGTNAAVTMAETSTSGTFDVALGQWISPPVVNPGTLEGEYTIVVARNESDAAANFQTRVCIRVVDEAGALVGSAEAAVYTTEWNTTLTAVSITGTIDTPIACSVGDRIDVEYGYRATNTVSTSYSGTMRYGGTDTTDLTAGDTGTDATTLSPYVEFNDSIEGFFKGIRPLPNQLNDSAWFAVEIAWGADLSDATGAGWSWTDITRDIRQADGVSISLGRADEAGVSQPASMSVRVDNADFSYSLGAVSPNYPNVKKNVPIRARLYPGDGSTGQLFQGFVSGFTPSWDSLKADIPVVTIAASGSMRRLIQGKDPSRSSLYRFITLKTTPIDYWPLEDGKAATQGSSAIAGRAPAQFEPIDSGGILYGKVAWAGDTDNPATEQAVQVSAGGQLSMAVNPDSYGNYWLLNWSMRYTSGSGGFTNFKTTLDGDEPNYYAIWYVDGTVELYLAPDSGVGATLLSTFSNGEPTEWDNVWHNYTFEVELSGSTSTIRIYRDNVLLDTISDTPSIFGKPTLLEFRSAPNPGGVEDPLTLGHVALWAADPGRAALQLAAEAHIGESAIVRLARLCEEEGVSVVVTGTSSATMGPQLPISFISLARECESADQGLLYDGTGPGLAYITRDQRENVAAALTFSANQVREPFQPVDDDQRTRNRVTVTGPNSSQYTYEDSSGPLGTSEVGVYDGSIKVNIQDSTLINGYAEWAVHLGTVEGYRYPSISLSMAATPTLASEVVGLKPSDRLRITDVATVFPALPDAEVNLLLEGLSMMIRPYEWDVTFKCSPYGPWVIGTLASDTGDTDEDLLRLDSDDSVCDSPGGHAQGSEVLFAFTASGVKWTELPDDYPLFLNVAGNKVRAISCSTAGGSSQDFVVDPLPAAVAEGATIRVWDPQIIGQ